MQNILFRADSSFSIGLGHIMRDLVLAEQFKDANIIFAAQDLPGNINYKILEANYKIKLLKSDEINELNELIKKNSIDLIVVDHYGIDADYEKQLKIKNPTLKIMVLDDTYEKHHCDILLNHNIYADSLKYKNLVPVYCELRCGEKYTLLRNEFIKERKKGKNQTNNKIGKNILIAMGGTDSININTKILKVLKKFNNIKVNVITTTSNNNLQELENYSKDKKWITIHINSNKIAHLISISDFAIITPSVIANEMHFMKLPFIAIKIAENQEYMYRYIKSRQFHTLAKFNEIELVSILKEMI